MQNDANDLDTKVLSACPRQPETVPNLEWGTSLFDSFLISQTEIFFCPSNEYVDQHNLVIYNLFMASAKFKS